MPDIRHRVGIKAPQKRIFEMLSTTDGLTTWWTPADGDSEVGGKLDFEGAVVMEIVEVSPNKRVLWRCVEGYPDWVGTTVSFELKKGDGETVLLFTHGGWREPSEMLHHCSTKWATFLVGLRSGLEGGEFRASPDDIQISSTWR
jgi:uncharacterized protein YndB with AHSA1/START domain